MVVIKVLVVTLTTVSAMAVTTVSVTAVTVPVMEVLPTQELLFLVLPMVPRPYPPCHTLPPPVPSHLQNHPGLSLPSQKSLIPVAPPLYQLELPPPPLTPKTVWMEWPSVVLPWLLILQTLPHLSQHHALLIQRFPMFVLPIFYPMLQHWVEYGEHEHWKPLD